MRQSNHSPLCTGNDRASLRIVAVRYPYPMAEARNDFCVGPTMTSQADSPATPTASGFGRHVLDLGAAAEVRRLEAAIREMVGPKLRRKGVVVAVSGGVDSAVCAALAARALGNDR